MIKAILAGANMLNAWAIALFFLRFWKKTGDRLFAWFAAAFILLGIERIAMLSLSGETRFHIYLIRLAAFLVIMFAILDKNRKPTRPLPLAGRVGSTSRGMAGPEVARAFYASPTPARVRGHHSRNQ